MLSPGSGLFRVDPRQRSAQENERLDAHPWRTRLHAYLLEASEFVADWVYFRFPAEERAPRPELFIYDWQRGGLAAGGAGPADLAGLYRQLWNYGRVPLALVLRPTSADVYNLLPPPDFDAAGHPADPEELASLRFAGDPVMALATAGAAAEGIRRLNERARRAWQRFSAPQFDRGAFWEARENLALRGGKSSLDSLVEEMRAVREWLTAQTHLGVRFEEKETFVHRLLIITLMVRFLEERKILPEEYFRHADAPADVHDFRSLLAHPRALLAAIQRLHADFNGDVFYVDPALEEILRTAAPAQLAPLADFATGQMEGTQPFFWQRYSFRHLPVEVVSYVYEDFLGGQSQAYFTPHHLVNLLLDEAMPESEVMAALRKHDPRRPDAPAAFPVLDPACGSGVFLVGAWRRLVDALRSLQPEAPPDAVALRKLMADNLFGVDIARQSVELTIFSLCVALCREFPAAPGQAPSVYEQLRAMKFPNLQGRNILEGDFFERRPGLLEASRRYRLIVGNPPFDSGLKTPAQESFDEKALDEDGKSWSPVPDDQLSYLFLRAVPPLLAEEGTACLVQPAGLLYNENPADFRRELLTHWDVSQILDFASISGLFTTRKEATQTQVGIRTVAVFLHRRVPAPKKRLLHATFRRTAALGKRHLFEIDPHDMHWVPRQLAMDEPRVWKANLLGGGRLLETYRRLTGTETLESYLNKMQRERGWYYKEGFNGGDVATYTGTEVSAKKKRYSPEYLPHRLGWDLLDTRAFHENGIDPAGISPCTIDWYLFPRKDQLFRPPHLLIKKNENLPLELRESGRELLFREMIVGVACPPEDLPELRQVYNFLKGNKRYLEFFAAFGSRYLVGRRALLKGNIMDLPYPEGGRLVFRGVQEYLRDDVIDFMIPLIKDAKKEQAALAAPATGTQVNAYARVFTELMGSVYTDFHVVRPHELATSWCVEFQKGDGPPVDPEDLSGRAAQIEKLLTAQFGQALRTYRVVRHFDGNRLFILKPKPQRYWLKSVAVRDADAVFAWLIKHSAKPRRSEGASAIPATAL